jgi:excisionase family DNA binding protein
MIGRTLRVAEVADRLSCSERTIRRWIADKTLPSVKIKGIRRIPEKAIDTLIGGGDPIWLDDPIDGSDAAEVTAKTGAFGADFDPVSTPKTGEKE